MPQKAIRIGRKCLVSDGGRNCKTTSVDYSNLIVALRQDKVVVNYQIREIKVENGGNL